MHSPDIAEIYGALAKAQTALSVGDIPLTDSLGESDDRRRLLYDLRRTAGVLLNQEGVCRCGRYVSFAGREDRAGEVWARVDAGPKGAFLSHVISCHSVWHCPVCGSRIGAHRRREVGHVVREHMLTGGQVWMGVLTIPHHKWDSCRELRQGVAKAYEKLISGRGWMTMKEKLGLVGYIRALEVTHGNNGWHPHLHILWFTDCHPKFIHELHDWLLKRWAAIVAKLGLGEVSAGAIRVEYCYAVEDAGAYVTKFGMDWEVTGSVYKKAKGESRTPWRILHDYVEDKWWPDGELFIEYAQAFKGARQLTWSRGLKDRYGVADIDDADIGEQGAEKAVPICEISEYALGRLYDQRALPCLLETVEKQGFGGAQAFIGSRYGLSHIRPCAAGLTAPFFRPNVSNTISDLVSNAGGHVANAPGRGGGGGERPRSWRDRIFKEEPNDEAVSGNWRQDGSQGIRGRLGKGPPV